MSRFSLFVARASTCGDCFKPTKNKQVREGLLRPQGTPGAGRVVLTRSARVFCLSVQSVFTRMAVVKALEKISDAVFLK